MFNWGSLTFLWISLKYPFNIKILIKVILFTNAMEKQFLLYFLKLFVLFIIAFPSATRFWVCWHIKLIKCLGTFLNVDLVWNNRDIFVIFEFYWISYHYIAKQVLHSLRLAQRWARSAKRDRLVLSDLKGQIYVQFTIQILLSCSSC